MRFLKSYFILILLFVVPSLSADLLEENLERIDTEFQITDNKNFFLINNDFNWSIDKKIYSSDLYKNKERTISFNEILKKTFNDGFSTQKQIQELYRYRIDRFVKLGELLPRLSVHISISPFIIDFKQLVGNLFSFILPHRWLALHNAKLRYKAQKRAYINNALDQFLLIELVYLELNRTITNYEIIQFYVTHLCLINRHIKDNFLKTQNLSRTDIATTRYLKSFEAELKTVAMGYRIEVGNQLPDILYLMNIKDLKSSNIDIEPPFLYEKGGEHLLFKRFNNKEKKFEQYDEYDLLNLSENDLLHQDKILQEVFSNSYELKTIKYFIKIAGKNRYIEASQDMLSTSNDPLISISFGVETVPKILQVHSLYKEEKINLAEKVADLKKRVEMAFNRYQLAVDSYKLALKNRDSTKEAFESYLNLYIDTKNEGVILVPDLQHAMEFHMANLLFFNDAVHNLLMAQAEVNRLRVIPILSQLHHYLPSDHETKLIKSSILKSEREYLQGEVDLKKEIGSLKNHDDLQKYLDHYEESLSPESFKSLLFENFSLFLNLKRGKSFYKILGHYAEKYQIQLSDREGERLRKKSLSFFERWRCCSER